MKLFHLLSITFLLGAAPYLEVQTIIPSGSMDSPPTLAMLDIETDSEASTKVDTKNQTNYNTKSANHFIAVNRPL